ncbi:MAG TPA: DUF4142 domain-containing protein [Xanthomonadaceae bacterium]|nr:DUF4142 domain-containing protein [Xanthomonadaceae bacterium]
MKAAIALLCVSLLVGSAYAQNTTSTATSANPVNTAYPTGSNADQAFFQEALAGGEREVMLSRIAMSQSGSAEVKSLASTIVDDHTTMNRELMDLGKVSEPAPAAADRQMAASLTRMSGALFDRTYLDTMDSDHRKAIELYERNSLDAHDSSTREFASTSLAMLQKHLVSVDTLQKNQGS